MIVTDENYKISSIIEVSKNEIISHASDLKISPKELLRTLTKDSPSQYRTFSKFLNGDEKFNPQVETIVNLYSLLYNTTHLSEVLVKSPEEISKFIINNYSNCMTGLGTLSDLTFQNGEFEKLTSSEIFNEVYIMTAGIYGTTLEKIRETFGIRGLQALDKMIEYGFVTTNSNDQFVRGKKLPWGNLIKKNFNQTFMNLFDVDEIDSGFKKLLKSGLADVTPKDYEQIIQIMLNAYNQSLIVMENSNPTIEEAIRITMGVLINSIDC